ncbi:acetate kinase [Planctomycetota bacterium]|nr:acetate kinase [Planctomycetota bacterium]
MTILVINCGSSSLKLAVIDPVSAQRSATALAQRLGSAEADLRLEVGNERIDLALPMADHAAVLRQLVDLLSARGLIAGISGIGHRVVHGGTQFSASARIGRDVLAGIAACVPLAPLHNPANLLGIDLCGQLLPTLPQVAVFDTSFHSSLPARASTYAVPREWRERLGVRRYGFHGTSHRFVSARATSLLPEIPHPRLITAHLGNGCSCAAIANGISLDTTMGLTPLEGLVMGTRSGSLDPAIVTHVAKATGSTADQVVAQLNADSGLKALSGISNDMRTILAAAQSGQAEALLAVEVFCYALAKHIAGQVVALGGLDALVFTGGIGEHSPDIRAQAVGLLGFLGLRLDPQRNAEHGRTSANRVSADGSVMVLVVPTDEELLIAQDTAAMLA